MSYNPLNFGRPLDQTSGSNLESTETSVPSSHTPHDSTFPDGNSSAVDAVSSSNLPPHASASPSNIDDKPPHPPLEHTRTAPTTFPINPLAHEHVAANNRNTLDAANGSENESPTPTLADDSEIPASVGGLHGQPQPGSKIGEEKQGDLQAGTTGGKAGAGIAALAAAELGLKDGKQHSERSRHHLDQPKKIERTATGTQITHNARTTTGDDVVQGMGMVPLQRKRSQPPGVSPFGGVAPDGTDAEAGLRAVRSIDEEDEREVEREKAGGPDPWAVKFEPGEKINPKNWGVTYRWALTGIAGLLVLNSTFASSAPSGIVDDMIAYFGFAEEVAILTISLFVAGYCVGPILWGPLSESYGRRPIFIGTFIVYTCMQVGCALSKNTASILIFRFLGGTFAAAPLTNSGALLADIWDTDHRGQAMSLFSLAPFAGPSIGPIVAGFIEVSGTNWRWVFWILTMFAGFCLLVIIVFVPETYAPKLLVNKAKKLRKETGEERWYAPLEKADRHLKTRLYDIICKPFVMLALEPMLLAITLYMSFVYGVVYLLFEAYPFVFIVNHGFNTGEEGLAFLGFFLGGFLCVVFFMTVIEPRYLRHVAAVAPSPPKPEKRLELCVISSWCMVIAMFWFGWTSYPSIHWISPALAGVLLGVSVLGMFVSLFNYIVDVYLWSAASALAGATVMRSAFGAAFPLFAVQMYEKLGTQWASSLLGFLALVMAPIPLVLMFYGKRLRARSKFSPNKIQ